MANRWLRFVIALLALSAAAAAGYRIVQQEQRVNAEVAAATAADVAAETAVNAAAELRAALHAYVAEGQGYAFWTARARTLFDRLRGSVLEFDALAAGAGVPLAETLDLVDRLGAAEERAQEYVRRGERLLAGDVIFNESRDLLEAIRLQIGSSRSAVAQQAATLQADIRREQALLALGAAGVLAFATLLLVIPGRSVTSVPPARATSAAEPTDEFESSARLISRVPLNRAPGAANAHSAPGAPVAPGAPGAPSVSLREAAAICTDLARASQTVEISRLLERAAQVLNASGVIVWMATADARELYPAASAGYDDRLLARIGTIRRDATNVTAGAFRDAAPKTSTAGGQGAAALAVPMMTPLGPAGVLSAEIREVQEIEEARLAVASIFAAQLASLVASIAAPAEVTPTKAQA